MITSFEVGAIFRIQDEATATFRRLAVEIRTLEGAIGGVQKSLTALGRTSFTGLGKKLQGLTEQTDKLKGVFGDVFAATKNGAAMATEEVAALTKEWQAVAAAAREAAGAMKLMGPGNPRQGIAGSHAGGGGGRSRGGFHASPMGVPIPGGHMSFRGGGTVGMAAMGALAYGVYEESQIEDIAARALLTGQIGVDANMTGTQAFKKLRDIIQRNSSLTGFDPKEIGEAILGSERQFAGIDYNKRMDVLNVLLPAAAQEARFKETGLKESAEALVGLAHMTGTYDPAKLPELYRQFNFASMITPSSLPEFSRALSYSMPSLVAGMGMDPQAIMFLTAMNQAAGIRSTKAGTWVQAFFGKLMPDIGINLTHSQEKHNEALRSMGLLDANGKPTWMVPGADGKTDWMSSLLKLSPLLGDRLAAMPETQRLQMLDQVFGKQGGREAGLMNLPEFIGQFPRLAQMMKMAPGGEGFLGQYAEGSPVQQSRKAFADLKGVLMDIGSIVLPPLIEGLQGFDTILKSLKAIVSPDMKPAVAPIGQDYRDAFARGMAGGAVTGGIIGGVGGAFIGGVGALPGAGAGAVVGGAIGGPYGALRHFFGLDGVGSELSDTKKNADEAAAALRNLNGALQGIGGGSAGPKKMNFIPPPQGDRPLVTRTALNIDGRLLAEVVSEQIARMNEFPVQAPYSDGRTAWWSPDSQVTAT